MKRASDLRSTGARRGGDPFIRYPDGTLRNLTREAGFGEAGVLQGASSIAVRDPSLHWNATKALFSMVIGAPISANQGSSGTWQIYEVTGMGQNDAVQITLVVNQPTEYNNVAPIYVGGGRIVFASDRPRGGEPHLYPQLDEYDSFPIPTGLWSLDPSTGDLFLLEHSPSGSFDPIYANDGRIVFSRWDHLQRDKQFDDEPSLVFDFPNESSSANSGPPTAQTFPEPRDDQTAGTNFEGNRFNQFGLWEILPDGSGEETLNHVGRHELTGSFRPVFNDDPALEEHELADGVGGHVNTNPVDNLLQVFEDPQNLGRFYSINSPRTVSQEGGRIIHINGDLGASPENMVVTYVTNPNADGYFRDPPAVRQQGPLAPPEQQVFNELGISAASFRNDIASRGLALIVSRDVTTRDDGDIQQPFNLRVAGTTTQTVSPRGGQLYDVSHLQIFQAELLRGSSEGPGRRVLSRPLRDANGENPPAPGGPSGSVTLGADGSMAALVPARRAISWQLTDPGHTPVVRERYWLTFQPGEVRVCPSCHGLNSLDQAGSQAPVNPPEALRSLLAHWQGSNDQIFSDGFESGNTNAWSRIQSGGQMR